MSKYTPYVNVVENPMISMQWVNCIEPEFKKILEGYIWESYEDVELRLKIENSELGKLLYK